MESREWLNDYELLKQISAANPFTVPAGYFDDLGDRIASRKNLEDFKNNNPTGGFTVPRNYFDEITANIQSRLSIETAVSNGEIGFTIPEGYFDEVTANIQSRLFIETAVNKEETGFAVPEGYFDELTANIQSRLSIETAVISEETGFIVPEGYFEELTANIQNRVFIEEALGGPAQPFEVPAGYFEKLNKSILDKTVNAGDVRRKGAVRKLFASTAFKYATAACFILALGGGVLISELNNPTYVHNHSFLHKQLSNVSISEIKSYLQLNVDAGDTQQAAATQGTNVDDADLKDALKNYADSVQ